ncbi:MAG: hypothetical protein JW800_06555 [Candidatus Omnitrophica bacterium]|nr:hypothetical protein [Candidatus Omnitrophota bacterium]
MAEDKEIQEGKIFAVIAYIGILCLLPLLLKKENKFALFHGKQGLVLFLGEVIFSFVGIIPILGWLIGFLGIVICGIFSIIGIVQALTGNYWKMPVVADLADKINI